MINCTCFQLKDPGNLEGVTANPSYLYAEMDKNGTDVRISVWAQEKPHEDKGLPDFADVVRHAWFMPENGAILPIERQTVGQHEVFFVPQSNKETNKTHAVINLDHDHYLYASAEHDLGGGTIDTKSVLVSLLNGLELLGDYGAAIRQRVGRHSTVTQTTEGLIDCGTFQLPTPSGTVTSVPTPSFLVLTLNHSGCDVQIQMFVTPKTDEEKQYPKFPAFLLPSNLAIINTNPNALMYETTVDGREAGIVFSGLNDFLSFNAAIEMDENAYLSVSANGSLGDGVDIQSLVKYLISLVESIQFGEGSSEFQFEGQYANYTYNPNDWPDEEDEDEDEDEVDPDWEPNDWDDEEEEEK